MTELLVQKKSGVHYICKHNLSRGKYYLLSTYISTCFFPDYLTAMISKTLSSWKIWNLMKAFFDPKKISMKRLDSLACTVANFNRLLDNGDVVPQKCLYKLYITLIKFGPEMADTAQSLFLPLPFTYWLCKVVEADPKKFLK